MPQPGVADARSMTPSDALPPALPDAPVLRMRDPGELIAAVPVLLGFHPRESLVLISMAGRTGRRLGLTLRADLPPAAHARAVCRHAAEGLLLDDPAGAVVLVLAATAEGRAGPPRRELAELAAGLVEERGVEVRATLWAASTATGAPWACYDPCGCAGVLPDPATTPLAAAAVVQGQVVRADRSELERSVAPADAQRVRRREVQLIRAVDQALRRPDAGADVRGAGRSVEVAVLDAALADAATGRLELDDARVLALATALGDPAVRDVALLRCLEPAAEQLWAALVRETPDPEAAEPAALLAVSALLRGDGALANVALDRAERAWPGHRLTAALRGVADAGIRPAQLRDRMGRGFTGAGAVLDGPARHRRIVRSRRTG